MRAAQEEKGDGCLCVLGYRLSLGNSRPGCAPPTRRLRTWARVQQRGYYEEDEQAPNVSIVVGTNNTCRWDGGSRGTGIPMR